MIINRLFHLYLIQGTCEGWAGQRTVLCCVELHWPLPTTCQLCPPIIVITQNAPSISRCPTEGGTPPPGTLSDTTVVAGMWGVVESEEKLRGTHSSHPSDTHSDVQASGCSPMCHLLVKVPSVSGWPGDWAGQVCSQLRKGEKKLMNIVFTLSWAHGHTVNEW